MKYYQCLLIKEMHKSRLLTVAWLPEKFISHLNKYLKLQENDGSWSDGWKLDMIYGGQEEELIKNRERDFMQFLNVLDE